jgi:hypothetical protein
MAFSSRPTGGWEIAMLQPTEKNETGNQKRPTASVFGCSLPQQVNDRSL